MEQNITVNNAALNFGLNLNNSQHDDALVHWLVIWCGKEFFLRLQLDIFTLQTVWICRLWIIITVALGTTTRSQKHKKNKKAIR